MCIIVCTYCESLSLKDALTGWSPCSDSYCPFGLWLHAPSHRSKRRSRPASEDNKHGNGNMVMQDYSRKLGSLTHPLYASKLLEKISYP